MHSFLSATSDEDGNLMNWTHVVALAVAAFMAACGGTRPMAAPASHVTTVDGVRIEVANTNPCSIRYLRDGRESELRLGITPPCGFHRAADGTVRTRVVNGARVLLVERSTPDAHSKGDCDTHLQAVLVSPARVRLSSAVERVAMCAPFQWDDVMFIGLAESAGKQGM